MSKEQHNTIDALRLQAFYDEELSAEEARALEKQLDLDPDAELRLDALNEMSALLRFDDEQHLEEVAFDGLWARISEALPEERADTSRAVAAGMTATTEELGWFERIREKIASLFSGNQGVLVPAFAAVFIASAIGIPMLLNTSPTAAPEFGDEDRAVADSGGSPGSPQPAAELVEHKVVEQPTLIIVQQPDFENDAMGTVQYAPNSNTPVIWYLGADGGTTGIVPASPGGGPAGLSPDEVPPWVPMMLDYMERIKERTQQGLPIPTPGRSTGEKPL